MTQPPVQTYSQPTDDVLIGWLDGSHSQYGVIARAGVLALVPHDGSYDENGTTVNRYGVLAHNGSFGILVFEGETIEDRREWMRDNAATWLV